MMAALFFLAALPLTVQTLSVLLHVFDDLDPARGLLRLCAYLIVLVGLVLVAGSEYRIWVANGCILVLTLHLLAQLILRAGVRYEWWVSERVE